MADINVTFDTPSIDVELTGGFTIDTTARTASSDALTAATTAETNAADALTAATTAETNAASALTAVTTAVDNFAAEYDSTATYEVGEYCLYDSVLYICTTAVETAGDFDSDYWTQVTVGDEVADLKSEISDLGTDGTYSIDFTWENGGIDNATGETNNDGSTTRSRDVTYYRQARLKSITNGSSSRLFIIFYKYDPDEDTYTFYTATLVSAGSTYSFADSIYNGYVRFDIRGSLTEAALVSALGYSSPVGDLVYSEYLELAKENAECYCTYNSATIEEDADNKVLYFTYSGTLQLRAGVDGSAIIYSYLTVSSLASVLGVDLVTSPDGVENCIAISDEYNLVYDIWTSTYKIVHRDSMEDYYYLILAQNGGYLVDGSPFFMHFKPSEEDEDSDGIPTYWDSAIETAEASINEYLESDEDSASFGFVTDTHIDSNAGYSGVLMKTVLEDCHIPVWFHGGDAVTGTSVISKSGLITDMNLDFEQFSEIENIGLRAIGNHDAAFGVSSSYDSNLTNAEINHYYHGIDREKYLQQYGEEKGYFYKDIAKDKLRCIVLDIIPFASQVDSSDLVTGSNKMHYHQFGSVQLAWFADVLASTPEDYSVVVCSHIAPVSLAELQTIDSDWSETVPRDYVQCRKIAEAYALKSTYSFSGTLSSDTTGDSYAIDVDFSTANGSFVCFFCGHTHKDFMLTLDNVNIVGTANDSISVSSNATDYAPSKTSGTATEQVMDFFCILPNSKKVYVVRLGAYLASNGLVRSFTYT